MASLPVIKRFLTEDFPTQSSWIGGLFYPLNLLLNTIYSALSNGITLAQNVQAQVKTLSVSGSSPTVSFPYQFAPASPIGISVINAAQTNSPAVALSGAVGCTWTLNSGVLTVAVQGLNPGGVYNITFVVWGG
jgi:hypothetical protein